MEAAAAMEAAAVSHDGSSDTAQDASSWRITAIEKFVPLTAEQKDRLRDKYERESAAKASGEETQTESLEEVLGAENATYYREQVNAAFKRVQNEEVERESVWLSRKLELSPEQENSVRQVFERVESEISQSHDRGQSGLSPQEQLRAMIAQNRQRSQLRNSELSRILTPEQLRTYAQLEAESSASDVEVFHDPGGAQPIPGSR
jgi:predicted ATPase